MIKKVNSVCTYCGVGCEISVEIANQNINRICAERNFEVSRGELCIKGKEGYKFLNSPNKIRGAFIRASFLKKNSKLFKRVQFEKIVTLQGKSFLQVDYSEAFKIVAQKIKEITSSESPNSFAGIGGARTNCESSYLFQKFTREIVKSPNVDNCARVCHSPSLRGLKATIGEGASTNPFSDIENSEFVIIIGSNTTEAHPIVGNKIIKAKKKGKLEIATIDIRETQIFKSSKYKLIIPFEANLLILNMLAFTILNENLENQEFIKNRTENFEEYKKSILNDPFANPTFFNKIKGYEYLAEEIPKLAREYATKKSMILWGLGVTEHQDGSQAVMAIANLALLTGNIGKSGAGLIPLRGQNNVQGACDMGMLPYFKPDYQTPEKTGLMTPEIFDEVLNGNVKMIWNIGEDLAHIHPNLNKVHKALEKLDCLIVNEVMLNEVTKFADIIFGVRSAYEKEGVYINAERRLHLSQPLVDSDLPDDWQVIQGVANALNSHWHYQENEDIWSEVQKVAKNRFAGADYDKLRTKRREGSGLQWPIFENETPILHQETFKTENSLGKFIYQSYKLRGQVQEILENQNTSSEYFYLSTGRTIRHYNNAAQTKASSKLAKHHQEDILLVSAEDKDFFKSMRLVKLKTKFGETAPLQIKITNKLKKGTLFATFHHSKSKINFIFGDVADELTKTAQFKSMKVKVIKIE